MRISFPDFMLYMFPLIFCPQFIEHEQLETNSQLEAELYLRQKKRNQEVSEHCDVLKQRHSIKNIKFIAALGATVTAAKSKRRFS